MKNCILTQASPPRLSLHSLRSAIIGTLGLLLFTCAAIAAPSNIPGHQDSVISVRNYYGEPVNIDIIQWFAPVPIFHRQADTLPIAPSEVFRNSTIVNFNMYQPNNSDGWYAGEWFTRQDGKALRTVYMVQQIARPGEYDQGYNYYDRNARAEKWRWVNKKAIQRIFLDVWFCYWRQPNYKGSIGGHDYDWEHFVVQLEYVDGVAVIPLTTTISQHATHYTLRWLNWSKDANHYRALDSKNPWGDNWDYPGIYVSQKGHGFCHTDKPASWEWDSFDYKGHWMWLPTKKNVELFQINPTYLMHDAQGIMRYLYGPSYNWGDAGKNPHKRVTDLGSRGYYNYPVYKTQKGYTGAEDYSLYKGKTLGSINRNECNNNQSYRVGAAFWTNSP